VLYLTGTISRTCGDAADARLRFEKAAHSNDLVWACRAGRAGCAAQLQAAVRPMGDEPSSWRLYQNGLLLADLGRTAEAAAAFRESLLLPDQGLSHHLARVAMAGTQ